MTSARRGFFGTRNAITEKAAIVLKPMASLLRVHAILVLSARYWFWSKLTEPLRAKIRQEISDDHAIEAHLICHRPDHRGACRQCGRPAGRKARQGELSGILRSQGADRVRPRRRDAAFVLVPDRPPDVRRDSPKGSHLR